MPRQLTTCSITQASQQEQQKDIQIYLLLDLLTSEYLQMIYIKYLNIKHHSFNSVSFLQFKSSKIALLFVGGTECFLSQG